MNLSYIYKYSNNMSKIIVKESQFKRLLETGSNSAAMDLDIYVQPVEHDTSNGNESIEETIDDIVGKLNEINFGLKSGKKLSPELKSGFYGILDELNKLFELSTKQ